MSRFSAEQHVSRRRPCPVCGNADWCAFTSDGRSVLCQRLARWNGKPAIKETNAGWLHAFDDRSPHPVVAAPSPAPRPALGRPHLDRVYRHLAELCGLDEHARKDLIEKRRFPQALDGAAVLFSLPRSGRQNEEISDALVAEFGREVIARVPGFAIACNSCDGAGSKNEQPCRPCEGLGKTRPRFRSVRGGQHDYALIACDENGLAFWGMSRRLPFDETKEKGKYVLLSSSRAIEASVAGLPKYHVAGRHYPRSEFWVTEGIIKGRDHCVVQTLPGGRPPGHAAGRGHHRRAPQLRQAVGGMKVVIAFDADKQLRRADDKLAKPNVARGEQRLIDAFSPEHDVFSAEWDLRSAKGIDDLLTAGGTPLVVDRYQDPKPRPRVPRPCPAPAPHDDGDDIVEVQRETRERIERRFTRAYRNTVAIIAPPPGTAKTGSGLKAQEITRQAVSWAVPRHSLADELVLRNATESCGCGSPRGTCARHAFVIHHDEGRNQNNCVQFDVIQAAREAGYGSATGALVCGTREKPICRYFGMCVYQGQFERPGSHVAPVEMVAQRPTSTEGMGVVIFDDIDGSQLLHQVQVTEKTLERARNGPMFADVREITELLDEALREAPGRGVYHAEAFSLLEYVSRRIGTTLEAVLAATPPTVRLAPRPSVDGFAAAVPGQLVELIGQLHQEYAWYRSGEPFTSGIRITAASIDFARLMTPVVKADGTTSLTNKAVAVLSSTPSPLLRQWTNRLGLEVVKPYQPKVALPPSVRVIQDVGGFYGKTSVAQRDLTTLLSRADDYLHETEAQNPAVVTHKILQAQVSAYLGISLERVLYFGNLRGSNAIRDADVLLIIGTPGMDAEGAYWSACAAYRGEGPPPSRRMEMRWQAYGGWRDQKGRGREIEVLTFADRRVTEIYESARRDELIQAVYRCRPHDRASDVGATSALTVVLMTAMPVGGLRVDELRFSGNAERAEEATERLDQTYEAISTAATSVSSRTFAEAAGTGIERAQEYLRRVSAVRSPTCINDLTHVGDQAAETSGLPTPALKCTCGPCPANDADWCNCGLFWRDHVGRWHCGKHDPPAPGEAAPVPYRRVEAPARRGRR